MVDYRAQTPQVLGYPGDYPLVAQHGTNYCIARPIIKSSTTRVLRDTTSSFSARIRWRSVCYGHSRTRSVVRTTILALAFSVGGWTSGCGSSPKEGATPTSALDVAQSYVARLSVGDEHGAQKLLTSIELRNGGSPIVTGRMIDVTFRSPKPVRPSSSNGRVVADAVSVWIDFRRVDETDPTLVNGPASWDFIIVKEKPDGPWRIDDQGLG